MRGRGNPPGRGGSPVGRVRAFRLARGLGAVRLALLRSDAEAIATKRCPYQFECEALNAPSRWLGGFAGRMADEAVILAGMLLDARGAERTHESLNAVMAEASGAWEANIRAAQDAGERLPECVLEAMEEMHGRKPF